MSAGEDAARDGILAPPTARLVEELAAEPSRDDGLDGGADGAVADMAVSERRGVGLRMLAALVRRRLKLPLRPMTTVATLLLRSSSWSSSVTQRSHSSHPKKVHELLQLTMETGETRSWNMYAKHTTKMMTEHTCCSITVESATSGQKSYG